MARDLMDENYYISGGGMIPIKWTAPEVSLCLIRLLHGYSFNSWCHILLDGKMVKALALV